MPAQAQYRIEHVAETPRGYRIASFAPGPRSEHVIRVAFPPGRRRRGSGRLIEILHPASEKNPHCDVSQKAKTNPSELLIFGNPDRKRAARERAGRIRAARLNPKRKRKNAHKPGCACPICKRARGENPKQDRRRRQARRHHSLRRLPQRRNVSDTEQAVKLYQSFHGHDPHEVAEKHVSAAVRKDYAALGSLDYLIVRTPIGERAKFTFEGDGVKLASSPDGKQLYAIGGNQNILSCLTEDSQDKDFIDLGDALEVEYTARKVHGGYEPVAYYHKFGEETGSLPRLGYDKLRKQIFFIGGDYRIDTSQGVSPGIEN